MSKTEKYTFNKLLENDAFIAWVRTNKNAAFWSEEQAHLEEEELHQFKKAIKVLKKLYSIPVDGDDTQKSTDFINQEFNRLLSSVKKEKKVIKINVLLKYAAAIVLLISLSVVLKFTFSTPSSFENHLVKTAYNTSDILIQTPSKEYYKIPKTAMNWVTQNGVTITVSKNNMMFSVDENKNVEKGATYTVLVPKNKKYNITLVDGTSVEVNENSKITFSTSIKSKARNVNLLGEAFFEVTHNKKRPFIVQSSDLKIKVLGTEFNVSNYEKNGYTSTTLIEGSINVSNPQGENRTITPGNQAKIYQNQNHIIVTKVNVQKETSWTKSRMIFENEKLENIIYRLKSWYPNSSFSFKNKEIKSLKFTGTLKKENSITHFLEMLKYTQNIHYTISEDQIILSLN